MNGIIHGHASTAPMNAPPTFQHQPVMLAEVMQYLKPKAGEVLADATLWRWGLQPRHPDHSWHHRLWL
jgi:hypothetical protein